MSVVLQADLVEKETLLPPKLGRHRWQAQRLQVLASDEVTGSLRTLRAFPMVAKDRFNSLQKRGVVQVCLSLLKLMILVFQQFDLTLKQVSVNLNIFGVATRAFRPIALLLSADSVFEQ